MLYCMPVETCQSKFCVSFEPWHDKTNKVTVRPAKTQISLGICQVWSESSLCVQWVAKDPSFLHADSEDSDQTGRMPSWSYSLIVQWVAMGFIMSPLISLRACAWIMKHHRMCVNMDINWNTVSWQTWVISHLRNSIPIDIWDMWLENLFIPYANNKGAVWSAPLLFAA